MRKFSGCFANGSSAALDGSMANTDLILEYLEGISPSVACDDAISETLSIAPRQQVNQIANRLLHEGLIARNKAVCPHCQRSKLVNAIAPRTSASEVLFLRRVAPQPDEAPRASETIPLDFREMRSRIIRFCRGLWKAKKKVEPRLSVTPLISALRDERLLPAHQANMMLTICGLRNVLEYEDVAFGHREHQVGQAAWSIIEDWANATEPDLWRPTAR